jgi:ABC-type lipoprotein export system ATPase subunit
VKNECILELQNISKEYGRAGGSTVTRVLSNISISVNAGESLSIIGPSGSGKSTLLNIMGTLDRPTSGTVFFNGTDLSVTPENRLSLIRNREIGFIFQKHHLLPQCTVMENVLVPTVPYPEKSHEEYHERARNLLESVGMGERLHYKPAELSGGEQLRTAVVRALINEPAILLADEPTGSLDNTTAKGLADLIVRLNKEKNVTLVVVTHSEELAGMMDRHYELRNGSLNPMT